MLDDPRFPNVYIGTTHLLYIPLCKKKGSDNGYKSRNRNIGYFTV